MKCFCHKPTSLIRHVSRNKWFLPWVPCPMPPLQLNLQIRYPIFFFFAAQSELLSAIATAPSTATATATATSSSSSPSIAAILWLVWQWIFMARLLRQHHPGYRGVASGRGSKMGGMVNPRPKVWIWWSGTLQGETWLLAKQTYSWRDYARPSKPLLHLKICIGKRGQPRGCVLKKEAVLRIWSRNCPPNGCPTAATANFRPRNYI